MTRCWCRPPGRAALAAFALHEQAFGFTREDVVLVRGATEAAQAVLPELDAERLRSLAARIEALLQPAPG